MEPLQLLWITQQLIILFLPCSLTPCLVSCLLSPVFEPATQFLDGSTFDLICSRLDIQSPPGIVVCIVITRTR